MALINCPECGKEISDQSGKCIHCGYKLKSADGKEKIKRLEIIVILLIVLQIVSVMIIISLVTSKTEKTKENCKVEGCSNTIYSNGLCIEHYNEQRNSDDGVKTSAKSTAYSDSDETIEEEVPEEVITFLKNTPVKSESCEFTMTGYKIATKIEPTNCTETYYHYYEATEGNAFLDVKFMIKNLRKSAVRQNAVVTSVKVFYDGDYEYNCKAVTVDRNGDFEDFASLHTISALETLNYHMLAEVPIEVKDSRKSLTVQVVVDGKTYESTLR